MISLVFRILPVVRTVDSAVTKIFLTNEIIAPENIKCSDPREDNIFSLPAFFVEMIVFVGAVGRDHQRQPGGSQPRVERAQVEPDQEFSSGLVKRQPGLVAAQSSAAIQGDEGNQVVLTELDIVAAFLLPRVLAVIRLSL